ncbi:tRNA pseudouridine(38-40) synthase TruA [Hazenella coriacea]|uniref:tRNA pseudouridine synthase A n=1 Tax=Hazenella coriacea TaxID=1179467 RepID=A0A4R3L7H2_9BACL|nr:tRNA pseudouridine(38-40) synthase TruA [Hazenella coriacea]TCS94154.1 tRNA pseudouridine38-40 synthase [Hazenella coriacea]
MKKVRLVIAYDGTDFSGFQRQPEQRTIQGTLEEALTALTGEEVTIHGSGRTDAGVHAQGQVCHFTTTSPIPSEKYAYILRRMLPRDLSVLSSSKVPFDFHARKSACWKTYRYQIDTQPISNIFTRRFRTHIPYSLDLEPMRKAGELLIGTFDFTSFCSAKTEVIDRVRTIYDCRVIKDEQGLYIELTGNGFLYNMVRIITGTLVEIGKHHRSVEEIPQMIQAHDRTFAGPTLPPEGLVLMRVGYTPWEREDSMI